MRFELKTTLTFSGDLEEAKSSLKNVIVEANEDILKRGVPHGKEGGAEVVDYDIRGNQLTLHIGSGRYVRAHDALLRVKKRIGEKIGPEFHIGVRKFDIDEYDVSFMLEKTPEDDIDLPYVSSINFKGNVCTFSVKGLTEEQLSKNYVDRIINRIKEKVDAQYYKGKEEMWELVWKSEEKEMIWEEDPTEVMEKKGWILKGPTKGKWFYNPKAASILRTMERIAVEEILKPLDFQEVIESMMVPFDVWMNTGHMEGIPNEAYYVCEPMTRDPEEWEEIVDFIKISKEVPQEMLSEMVTRPKAGLCYAQCPNIYWSLKNQTIADESLPLLLYDRSSPSARYESGGRHGIERVDEFHRIEPVYIGTKEQLISIKEDLIERYTHVFENILELEWRMARVSPFYLQQSGDMEEEVDKELGTIDFEAYLPYRGSREDSEWLEFQNLSIFSKYTETFNIKSRKSKLYSGCSGIGLERWTAAFLAQKGLEPDEWPEGFKRWCGDLPKGINLL